MKKNVSKGWSTVLMPPTQAQGHVLWAAVEGTDLEERTGWGQKRLQQIHEQVSPME